MLSPNQRELNMKLRYLHPARWLLCACTAVILAACGGGGGEAAEEPRDESSDPVIPAPPPAAADLRNGTYTMAAGDGYEYTLTLDFDAKTYKVAGNNINETGAIEADGSEYEFKPGNATGASGFNTFRFSYVDNTVVGEYALPAGALPFIAARSFATHMPTSTLTFNSLGRWVNAEQDWVDTSVEQSQITSDGKIRLCYDNTVNTPQKIETCPSDKLFELPLTITGNQFSYVIDELTVTFRLAQVGTDLIFMRSSASRGATRAFIVGTPALTSFEGGTFTGGTAGNNWATVTMSASSFSVEFKLNDGSTDLASGSVAVGEDTFGSLAQIESESLGPLYGISSTKLGVIVAAPGSAQSGGGLFLGVRR